MANNVSSSRRAGSLAIAYQIVCPSRRGESEPFYERFLMRQLNIEKLKDPT